ncbi:Non-hemolytic phospholipase C precursor [compost metagenome]
MAAGETLILSWDMAQTGGWYDISVHDKDDPSFLRRLAGRIETGSHSTSDPAMGQDLILQWTPQA